MKLLFDDQRKAIHSTDDLVQGLFRDDDGDVVIVDIDADEAVAILEDGALAFYGVEGHNDLSDLVFPLTPISTVTIKE